MMVELFVEDEFVLAAMRDSRAGGMTAPVLVLAMTPAQSLAMAVNAVETHRNIAAIVLMEPRILRA